MTSDSTAIVSLDYFVEIIDDGTQADLPAIEIILPPPKPPAEQGPQL